jgi:hypothetical protein
VTETAGHAAKPPGRTSCASIILKEIIVINTPSLKEIKLPPFHPLANMFPLIEGREFDELVGDLQRRPLNYPIVVHKGMIVGGRNRARACQKAGREPTYVKLCTSLQKPEEDITEEEIRRYIIQENLLRRNLTPEQRNRHMRRLLGFDPLQSDRVIAAQAGVDHKTVGIARKQMESTGEIPQLKKRTGQDGKSRRQPAPKPRSASAPKLAAVPKPAIEQIREITAPDEELELLREFARFVIEREGKCNFRAEDRPQWLILRERIQATLRAAPTPSHREFIAKTNGAAATANVGRMTAQREIPE